MERPELFEIRVHQQLEKTSALLDQFVNQSDFSMPLFEDVESDEIQTDVKIEIKD